MMNFDFLQLNQTALFVFLVALIGVVRERTVLPFVVVALGSFLSGNIAAALISSLIVWTRFDGNAPVWVRFKDAMAMFFIIAASALPEPYREFMICLGTLFLSIHFGFGKLGVIPALLLTHIYLGESIPLEFVLGGAGFYIVTAEILRLAKSPHEERVLQWLELPVILVILYPFLDAVLRWSQDEVLLGSGIGLLVVILGFLTWFKVKKPDLGEIYENLNAKSTSGLTSISGLVGNRLSWIRTEAEPEVTSELSFDRLFWGMVMLMGIWGLLVLLHQGGAL